MRIFSALSDTMFKTKDNASTEHLEVNEYRNQLRSLCDKYLKSEDDILEFECLGKALPYIVTILEEPLFLREFEFQQVSDTVFQIRLRSVELELD